MRIHRLVTTIGRRYYATVVDIPHYPNAGLLGPGVKPPIRLPTSGVDKLVLEALRERRAAIVPFPDLVENYTENAHHVLPDTLPCESRPTDARRVNFDVSPSNVVMVVHAAEDGDNFKVAVSSGFAVHAPQGGPSFIVTCSHALEEMRWSPLVRSMALSSQGSSGTFVLSDNGSRQSSLRPVSSVLSSLPQSDLMIMSKAGPSVPSLPLSMYPAQPGTAVRAHFVSEHSPIGETGWRPWLGGTYSKWVKGTVLGYRSLSGQESQPGTYDELAHILFNPPPTATSSGGPIVDEQSGAVIGVILGTRMDNHVEGLRGWGVPADKIFEMFSLPGMKGK